MTQAEIEQRLLSLEAEIRLLKSQAQPNKADPKWVLAHAGRFADDSGFDEVVRLGREYRESLDAKPKKARGKRGYSVWTAKPAAPKPKKKPTQTGKPKSPVKNGRA
jgi:hypothetical protein